MYVRIKCLKYLVNSLKVNTFHININIPRKISSKTKHILVRVTFYIFANLFNMRLLILSQYHIMQSGKFCMLMTEWW